MCALRPTEIILDIDHTERERFDQSIDALRSAEKDFHSSMPRLLQLCIALFDALMSRSEIVCYFAMILNHMVSASLLSLAYPLSVFLWAMLSVPRPTKTYWITIITYTEVRAATEVRKCASTLHPSTFVYEYTVPMYTRVRVYKVLRGTCTLL